MSKKLKAILVEEGLAKSASYGSPPKSDFYKNITLTGVAMDTGWRMDNGASNMGRTVYDRRIEMEPGVPFDPRALIRLLERAKDNPSLSKHHQGSKVVFSPGKSKGSSKVFTAIQTKLW